MNHQLLGLPANPEIAKAQAKRLRTALGAFAPDLTIGHSQSLELIARTHGEQSWGRLNSLISSPTNVAPATPAQPPMATAMPEPAQRSAPGNHWEQRFLQGLWSGLQRAKVIQVSERTRVQASKLVDEELIAAIALEGYLDTLDASLGGMMFDMGTDNLLKAARVAVETRFQRPKVRDNEVMGFSGLRPASFAAVLIWMEHLGFDTHPEVFYERFIEDIKRAKYLGSDEMACLWHHRGSSKRFKTSEYFVDAETDISNVGRHTVQGRHGLTIEIERSTDPLGLIRSIRIYR